MTLLLCGRRGTWCRANPLRSPGKKNKLQYYIMNIYIYIHAFIHIACKWYIYIYITIYINIQYPQYLQSLYSQPTVNLQSTYSQPTVNLQSTYSQPTVNLQSIYSIYIRVHYYCLYIIIDRFYYQLYDWYNNNYFFFIIVIYYCHYFYYIYRGASQNRRSGTSSGTTPVPYPRSIPPWRIRSIPLFHTSVPYLWSIRYYILYI